MSKTIVQVGHRLTQEEIRDIDGQEMLWKVKELASQISQLTIYNTELWTNININDQAFIAGLELALEMLNLPKCTALEQFNSLIKAKQRVWDWKDENLKDYDA